ncbi:MAG TPA: helix-turn-helix domain-containing protein, partial [Mariniphaga sp.]|nr:helix-turn-helix domain-containing protein [Mariniphaga sp.]
MDAINKNQKYIQLMTTARQLFWKHGFRRVSVQEICQKAGESKMTFYKFFDNKIELAKQVFLNEVEQGLEKFNRLIEQDLPVQEKLEKMMLLKAEGTDQISNEFMQDFYLGTEPELKNFVEA